MLEIKIGAPCQTTTSENRGAVTMTQSSFHNCQPFTRTFSNSFKNEKFFLVMKAMQYYAIIKKFKQIRKLKKGVVSIKDLLKEYGRLFSFQEFKEKFSRDTNFLQYFQIISAIPDRLQLKARQIVSVNKQIFTSNDHFFYL